MVPGWCESVYIPNPAFKVSPLFCQAVPSERLEQLQRCARWQVDPWAFPGLWGAMGKNGKSMISERVGVFFCFDRLPSELFLNYGFHFNSL